jgi:hypothetical protein
MAWPQWPASGRSNYDNVSATTRPQHLLPPQTPPPPTQLQAHASPGQAFPPLGGAASDFPALGSTGRGVPPPPLPSGHAAEGAASGEWETVSTQRRGGAGTAVPRGLNYGGAGGSGLGASVGQSTTRAGGSGAVLGAASVENSRFSSGYIFGCKPDTYQENINRQLFGVTKQHLGDIQKIAPSSALFLFNYSTKMLYGVFVPNGPGGLNLEPEAWKSHEGAKRVSSRNRSDVGSPYPAQIRFNILKKCEPLHYKVWGHIPTPKPGGYNQFELHLDAEQASKLAALFLKGK